MYSTNKADVSVRPRVRIEKRIIRKLIADLLQAGYRLSVFDGEEETPKHSEWGTTDARILLKAVYETDEDYIYVYHQPSANGLLPQSAGWVRLVYGNSGWDVICDYTVNLETALAGVNALASQIEGGQL